jgi:threonyl-tRNA synthetase
LLPKGARVIQQLQRFVEDEEEKRGWLLTKTPYMAKRELYKISGHWDHYLDGMFVLGDPDDYTKDCYALRPMTCPFQYQAYLNKARSYRDLPLRYNETSTLFRNEDSGEMHGLIRVRQFTISEGHLMCRPDQLEEEFKNCLDLAMFMLKTVGLYDDVSFRFSQWDPKDTKKYIGTQEDWDEAQGTMKRILDDLGVKYKIGIGEAAFYGPKLDVNVKPAVGNEYTLSTCQLDFCLPMKFNLTYIDSEGDKRTPVVLHRAILGSLDRFMAYILEETKGNLPLWLAPVQVKVLPVKNDDPELMAYAEKVYESLYVNNVRVELDDRAEKLGYKMREAQIQKVPYILFLGNNEKDANTVTFRLHGQQESTTVALDEFVAKVTEDIVTKKYDL